LGVDPGKHPAVRDTTTPGGPPSGGDVRQAALSGLLAVLAAAGPLILIVDDLHWASPALLAALRRLGRELTGRTLLVCVGRSDVLETAHEWTVALPAAELLLLAPLDEPAADRLLRAYLGGAELEPPARALLLDRAQGNPFFLAELLHLLVDRGLLRRVGAGWRLEQDVPAELLPAGVQAVLAARIDGLDPVAKAVLRDAAVLGARFPVAALLALEAGTEDAVRAALDVLVSRGLLEEAAEGDTGPAYVFRHGLARDVAYAGIPKADRARRHAAAALWAAHDLGGPAEEVDSFVARQAERAVALAVEMGLEGDVATWGIRPVGAAALLRLGQAAVARDEDPAALELLGRALDLDGADPAVRLPALVARAAAHAGHSRLDEATADLPEPLSSADGVVRAGALVVAGTVARRRGEEDAATAYLVSALAAASEAGTDRVTSEALRELGLIAYFAGRLTVAEQHFRAALELAERVGDRRGAGWALQQLSWSATTRGDYREAERALLRAADVFAGLDDAGGLSWCAGTEAFVRLLEGRIREARRLARGLVVVAEGMGERFGMAACLTIDAYAAAELGELTVAGAAAQRAYDEFVALGDTWGQGLALVAWAVVERGSGQPEQAVIRLERAVALAQAGRHAVTGSLALGVLGYAQLDAGDAEAAEATALRAMAVLAELDLEPQALVMPRVLLGMALRAQGRLDRALDLLAAAAADADSPSLLFPRRQALAHWAGALLAAGEPRSALAVAEQALAVPAEDVRSRVVALRVLAGCYAELGDAPAARFAAHQALGVARECELVREIQASEQLAAGLAAPAG
ncbi:MAG TPA: tetratricopeptide repeat protein, partial [Mycobacteriales bacterium]|nr:tetratricopeptide repeat protein [Mycobacteriales bacterium]